MTDEWELIFNEQGYWRLLERADGTLCLAVTVGGIAMYEVRVRLDADETARYREEGESFLDDLAYKIGKNESDYADSRC